MREWLESVYSDGTECFVSNPQPEFMETVKISIRMYEDAPVKHVFLRTVRNGAENLIEAVKNKVENGLAYYEAELQMTEKRMHYHFYLVCDDIIYYYNQKEITTYIPDHTYDFKLLTDYRQPSWVKRSVFYQIFPERFCNGNPDNDVKDGEYTYQGHPSIQHKTWEEKPLIADECFSLDFFGGDLEGIKEKIPYLKELGVTAVYLNPIFRSPSLHKYDCIDYMHVDEHFGGDEALAELSKALHENGMKLMLDISINHTGSEHIWFNKSCEFFDKSQGAYHNPDSKERSYYFFEPDSQEYEGWAGHQTLPTLNYTSEELRKSIYKDQDSVLRKWLKPPYNIDGWRFDVADVFAKNNEIRLDHELWPEIRKSIREENEEAYILAEDWGDCAQYMQGDEWDAPMNYFGCGRVFRQFLGLPDLFLERNPILKQVSYKMTAEDAKARIMEHFAKLPYVIWQNQFNLMDSHDVPRIHNFKTVNPQEHKGAVIMQFMLTGTPSIYYGDEIGIDGDIFGDEGFRHTMPWSQIPGRNPQTYEFYQKLAHLKKEKAALQEGGMKFLCAQDQILALARFYGNEVYIAIMSTNDKAQRVRLPIKALGVEKLDKTTDLFGTKIEYETADDKGIWINVEPHQAYLIEC